MNNKFICQNCSKDLRPEGNKSACAEYGETCEIENGIISFVNDNAEKDIFDEALCNSLFEMEKKHFWHIGRKEIIWEVLSSGIKEKINGLKMIEIGCGTGNILRFLKSKGLDMEGADTSLPALNLCKKRADVPLYRIDPKKRTLPFLGESYDIIGLFDVLEHVEKDQVLLDEVYRICKRNGKIIITVPANKHIWSYFDVLSGHKRRYSKDEIVSKLEKAGFKIEKISYYMFFLFPIVFLRKIKSSKNKNSQFGTLAETRTLPLINGIFLSILRLEKILLSRINLPFGASIICLAKK